MEDVADAVARMALETEAQGVFNVSTGRATSVLEAHHQLSHAILGSEVMPNVTHTKRDGDIRHCIGDSSRLKEALPGWAPRSFEKGIQAYAASLK